MRLSFRRAAVWSTLAALVTVLAPTASLAASVTYSTIPGSSLLAANATTADARGLVGDGNGNIYRVTDGRRELVATTTAGRSVQSQSSDAVNSFADSDGDGIVDLLQRTADKSAPGAKIRAIVVGRGAARADQLATAITRASSAAVNRLLPSIDSVAVSVPARELRALANLPDVFRVEPDLQIAVPKLDSTTMGTRSIRPYHPMTAATAVSGYSTWRGSLTGAGVDVAVLDTGVDARHKSLSGRVLLGGNFVQSEGSCPTPPTDRSVDVFGHGTHVAGIIAGDAASGGLAPSVRIVNLRVFNCTGSGYMSDVDAALEWLIINHVANGLNIRVANMSLGASVSTDGTDSTSRLVNKLTAAGVNVFVAAGNSGLDGRGTVGTPGVARYGITVGAFAAEPAGGINQAFFSSRGPVPSGANKPDISAPGVEITSARANTTDFTAGLAVSGTLTMSGTSMATPWAAGLAALAIERQPSLVPSGTDCGECPEGATAVSSPLADLLRRTASDRSMTGWDTLFGYGAIEPARVLNSETAASSYAPSSAAVAHFDAASPTASFRISHPSGVLAVTLDPDVSISQSSQVRVRDVSLFDSFGNEIGLDVGRYYIDAGSSVYVLDFAALEYTTGVSVPAGNYFLRVSLQSIDGDVYVDVAGADSVSNVDNLINTTISSQIVRPGDTASLTLSVSSKAAAAVTFAPRSDSAGITFDPASVTVAPGDQATVNVQVLNQVVVSGARISAEITAAAMADGLIGYRTYPKMIAVTLGTSAASPRFDGLSLQAGVYARGERNFWLEPGTRVIPTLNGDLVFFVSDQALAPGAVDGVRQVYVKDRRIPSGLRLLKPEISGTTSLFDVTPDGTKAVIGTRSALVASDTNGVDDFYVVDTTTGAVELVSLRVDNSQNTSQSLITGGGTAAISDDGTKVAFQTWVPFAPGDAADTDDVFLRDLVADTTTRLTDTKVGGVSGGWVSLNFNQSGTQLVFAQWRYLATEPASCTHLVATYPDGTKEYWVQTMFLADLQTPGSVSILTSGASRCLDLSGANTRFDQTGRLFYFEYSQSADRSLIDGTLTPQSLGSAVAAPPNMVADVLGVDSTAGVADLNLYLLDYSGRNYLGYVSLSTTQYAYASTEQGQDMGRLAVTSAMNGSLVLGGYTFQGLLNYDDNSALDPYIMIGRPPSLISSFTPTFGAIGASVTISGSNLAGATSVKFNGTVATILSNGASSITTSVPVGATSGPITVSTASGTAVSSGSFIVAPTISSFTPAAGGFGASVTIFGSNLSGATSVKFNGMPATISSNSATSITTTVPAGATAGYITVTTAGGTATSGSAFLVAPAITSFTPMTGPAGTVVAITGTNLGGATSVTFNGTAATILTNSETSITASVAADSSTGFISVTTAAGTVTSGTSFTYIWPPSIDGFSPTSGPAGTSVTITGGNLAGATSVKFNGVAGIIQSTSNGSITATVPPGASTGPISVTTSAGTATSATSFTFTPAPTISSFTPTSGGVGTSVTITGSNLTGATSVKFNGSSAPFTVLTATSIVTSVPAGATTGNISVTTPAGTASSSSATTPNFSVSSKAVSPTVTSFSPTTGQIGAAVTINGTNLAGATSVKFGTFAVNSGWTVISATRLTIPLPAGAVTGKIAVSTAGGTGTSTGTFTVTAPAPTISSFNPTSGPVGTVVTIYGTNLLGASAVKFNGTAATFTVNSATQITATVPSGATSGTISVTTAGGTVTSGSTFSVTVPSPAISGFTPTSGGVGTSVTITGTYLTGASAVRFNGTTATFTVNSATQITATVPNGATTGLISVTTGGGTAFSGSNFTVLPTPTIGSFTPTSGGVGTSVTITGSNFTGATAVKFNGVTALYTVLSATSIVTSVPGGATSGSITVTTPYGTATSNKFTVGTKLVAPTITSFNPTSGSAGTVVVITGTNLAGVTSVKFNGVAATSFTVLSATSISVTVPAGASTGKISVTTAGGTATSTGTFTYV